MNAKRPTQTRKWIAAGGLFTLLAWSECPAGEPPAAAVSSFNNYVSLLETRLLQKRQVAKSEAHVRTIGMIERVDCGSAQNPPGAMLHHWRAGAFAAGAKAADFATVMQNFAAYPRYFAPEVTRAKVLGRQGDLFAVTMRVAQQHVVSVVLDTEYQVSFGRVDDKRGWSVSRSTRIAEIAAAGTSGERVLTPGEEHGFLWRQNTYWSYEERDGGLYLQVESVSLTRAIPRGLTWAVKPFVESVPRESLEFTLRATCDELKRQGGR